MALQFSGYHPTLATNGLEGLQMMLSGPTPDIIIMDLYMPTMNGSTLLSEMSLDPVLRTLPIILMTGAVPDDLPPLGSYQCLVKKPFRVTEVLSRVKELLQT